MKSYRLKFIILAFFRLCLVKQMYPQTSASDSSFHPYHVNYWVTGSILASVLTTNFLGSKNGIAKDELSLSEIQTLNRSIINNFDSWALKQDPLKGIPSKIIQIILSLRLRSSSGFLMFDKQIRQDWFDVLLMYVETMSITH